jgi:uncharacterized peroxidase-related enzyme
MQYSPVSDIPIVEEAEAEGEIARIYEAYKRQMQIPYVPNILRGLATSPAALAFHWGFVKHLHKSLTLPESLFYMILYAIAESKNTQYCSANNELTCRTLGIDGSTIGALVEDIDVVTPQRMREIIKFALKAALDPQGLIAEDYQRVRDSGVSDDELVEIILIAAISNYNNTLSDALKIPVDAVVLNALED